MGPHDAGLEAELATTRRRAIYLAAVLAAHALVVILGYVVGAFLLRIFS